MCVELPPNQLPPLDENGIPKYKGKKRGRKPKERKRKHDPNREKRKHTAYTLFMHETYPGVKEANQELPSKDIISIVAKRWRDELSAEERKQWKARAKATHSTSENGDSERGTGARSNNNLEDNITAAAVERLEDDNEGDDEGDQLEEDREEEQEDEDEIDEDEPDVPQAEILVNRENSDDQEDDPTSTARKSKRSRR